jgi:sarcosine oxidase
VATRSYDVIVIWGVAMGSAAAWHAARRGHRVLCLDRFAPPHAWGSSHGATRIIREAYYEHPQYVPLVRRSYDLWDELARNLATPPLYRLTGGAYLGAPDCPLVRGVLASCAAHDIAHEVLDPDALARRFPVLRAEQGMVGVVEHRAGFLDVDRAIRGMRLAATAAGAELLEGVPVERLTVSAPGVTVHTAEDAFTAPQAIVAVGAWVRELLPQLAALFRVQRQTTTWCSSIGRGTSPDEAPVTIWELPHGEDFYTIPDDGEGFKIGVHYGGEYTSISDVNRHVAAQEAEHARDLLTRYMPAAAGEIRRSSVCLYTNTPDLHFVIDWLPGTGDRVLLLSPCSGHGFKFAPAIGEVAAALLARERTPVDLTPFRLSRFDSSG